MQSIEFPVLLLGKNFVQGRIYSSKDLSRRTIVSFNEKIFDGAIVIDSQGSAFKVLSYSKSFPAAIVIGNVVDLTLDFFMRDKDQLATWIDFELSTPEKFDFSDVKRKVSDLVHKNPKWFDSNLEGFKSIERMLDSYQSLPDMIDLFSGYP